MNRFAIVAAFVVCGFPISAPAGDALRYVVTADDETERLTVRVTASVDQLKLYAQSSRAGRYLESAAGCDGAQAKRAGRAIKVSGSGSVCVEYAAAAVNREVRRGRNALADRNAVVRFTDPADWLWLPSAGTGNVQVEFRLPPGQEVTAPWQPTDDRRSFRLPASARGGTSLVAFGQFPQELLRVGEGNLRVAYFGVPSARLHVVRQWLGGAAANVAAVSRQFPHQSPQVLVFDSGEPADSAVGFGMVARTQGESVRFYVNSEQPLDAFVSDWTATHEFAHLLLPAVSEKWISEGFATYYQNVLLARAGTYTEQFAWERLTGGFDRGRKSMPADSPRQASRSRSADARMKVYWAGAALALRADVEIRRNSAGRQSLDTALVGLQDCCLPASRRWTPHEVFERMDSFIDVPVLVALYERYAGRSGFPDVEEVLAELGIRGVGPDVQISDDARLAALRRELLTRDPPNPAGISFGD